MLRIWLPFVLTTGLLLGAGVQPEITHCSAVRELTRQEAATARRVHVVGVVTLQPNPVRPFVFTLDDGTGIWVSVPKDSLPSKPPLSPPQVGDKVEVIGHTSDGRFSPTIVAEQVIMHGRADLPAPHEATILELSSGKHDNQRVTLHGVVQAAEMIHEWSRLHPRLRVRSVVGPVNFSLLTDETVNIDRLVDAEVTLTGVCLSYFNASGQFLGARVYSNDVRDLTIDRPGGSDPYAAPEVPLARVMPFSPEGVGLHRRRVRGVVTLARPGEYVYIQDGNSALRISTHETAKFQPGEIVEAAGFFELTDHKAQLNEAVVRKVGEGEVMRPVQVTRQDVFVHEPQPVNEQARDFDDRLVAIRGRYLSLDHKPGELPRLNLIWEGALAQAEFVGHDGDEFLSELRPGSELRVSGICLIRYSASRPVVDWPQPTEMSLLVRSVSDIEVLAAAPFWNSQRLFRLSAGLTLVLLAALAWVVLLRRRVAMRSRQLADEMRARRDAAVEFESSMRERNRLAADLHDTMEQSLTGLAMQLEASKALQATTPEQSVRHLSIASHLLARSREDLRRSIWNLRANPLEKQTLAEALEEIAADRSAGLAVKISVKCIGGQRPLADFVSGNMLLLAQEGITNALKHAEAAHVDLVLLFATGQVTLSIRDDGRGFDATQAAGPHNGHFGLQGMRERAKRLGGILSIKASPGSGTLIEAVIPDQVPVR